MLYLTGWPRGEEWIFHLARKLGQAYFIYAASLDEFRRTRGQIPFASGDEIRSRDFISLKISEGKEAANGA